MAEYRMEFVKAGNLKYLSHLELIRALERAARRSKLPLEYSEGYHPHPKLSFGPALALGIASNAEYFDIQLGQEMDPDTMRDSMNRVLPEQLKITAAGRLNEPAVTLSALINRVAYLIELAVPPQSLAGAKADLDAIMAQQELLVQRLTKTGQKMVNIRALLHTLTIVEPLTQDPISVNSGINSTLVSLTFRISGEIGNNGNLRPEEIIRLIKQPLTVLGITRVGLYHEEQGMITKPMDFCVRAEI